MLTQVAEGVFVHQSEFLQSNTVVVLGGTGVLLIDPGLRRDEMACLAKDVRELGQAVVAGFSTHPHWDHLLWDAGLGAAPRYATARGAETARQELSNPDAKARITDHLAETEVAGQVPLDEYGLVTGLPADAAEVPWDGPRVRIIEHQAHAPGHAALLIAERGVLVAGDTLSDVLIPFLDLEAANPIEDYLAALRLFEGVADDVHLLIPGHGSVCGADQVRARIDQDRAYVRGLRVSDDPGDPRLAPSAPHGAWLPGVHAWQRQGLAERSERDGDA